jgi:hypothetical protein
MGINDINGGGEDFRRAPLQRYSPSYRFIGAPKLFMVKRSISASPHIGKDLFLKNISAAYLFLRLPSENTG